MTRRQLLSRGVLVGAGSAGCRRNDSAAQPGSRPRERLRPIRVVVTTPIIAECVAEIAGDAAEVTSLLGPGLPISQLTRSGLTESLLVSAEAVAVLGLGFDTAMDASVERARKDGVPLCVLETSLPRDRLLPGTQPGRPDPHVWLDPDLWSLATVTIEEMLAQLRPARAAEFEKRGDAARFRFEELGAELRRLAAVVPETARRIVTRNAPLRYLGRAAGVGIEIGDPGPEYPPGDAVESLAPDILQPKGEDVLLRGHSHDLSTLGGLITHALDTILLRVT